MSYGMFIVEEVKIYEFKIVVLDEKNYIEMIFLEEKVYMIL